MFLVKFPTGRARCFPLKVEVLGEPKDSLVSPFLAPLYIKQGR